jgi:predicted choloylglycine hydrolase
MLSRSTKTIIVLTALLSTTALVSLYAQQKIIELGFIQPQETGFDTTRTLQTMVKVQGTGVFTEDGLYLLTQVGDREEIYRRENRELMDNPMINQTWRHCSVFSTNTGDSLIMGRNWDNQNVGSIIVNLCYPPDGYASISFSRSIDVGFGLKDLEEHKTSMFGHKLLLAPFYSMDGINEYGLAVACTGAPLITVNPIEGKEQIAITFLIRKILDQTKYIDEAVELANNYVPFDIDKNMLCSHLMVADSTGRSVILEYVEDQWRAIYSDDSWQILSTKAVFGKSDDDLRELCWRHKSIAETFDKTKGHLDWSKGITVLQDVHQKGTTWSVVYSLRTRELYFSVYQNWDTVYHLRLP